MIRACARRLARARFPDVSATTSSSSSTVPFASSSASTRAWTLHGARASTSTEGDAADARDAYSQSLERRAAAARKVGNKRGEASSERVAATMRADGTAPKFYEAVNVAPAEDGTWRVTLDDRVLRTPKRNEYGFATKSLAVAVAMEWEAQTDRVAPFTMPLTGLSATAIDHMGDAETRNLHVETLLKHFRTDVVRVRSSDDDVRAKQEATHDPIVRWATKEFGPVEVSDSIFGPETSEKTLEVLRKRLHSMCPWELTCAFALSAATKSLLIGLKTLRGGLTVEEAIAAARVEEEAQIEEWGLVEGGHDLDQLDIKVKVSAPVMLMKLRREGASKT
jgi:ATP synthase F1 complex assembly factor 2